jgi:hypothetical protein
LAGLAVHIYAAKVYRTLELQKNRHAVIHMALRRG